MFPDARPIWTARPFLLCAAVLLLWGALSAHASGFEFAAIGDVPYGEADSLRFLRLRDRINAEDLAFVLHVGDIKGGSGSCADEVLESRVRLFSTFRHPFLLTPGDNEWTDCHRPGAGFYPPLDRLAKLRVLFFTPPGRVLGGGFLKVVSQAADPAWAEFPENVRWSRGGVVFAALHLVGSHNALAPFPARTPADDAEVERRTEATVAWMRRAFQAAGESEAAGVLIAIHGNPRFETGPGGRPAGAVHRVPPGPVGGDLNLRPARGPRPRGLPLLPRRQAPPRAGQPPAARQLHTPGGLRLAPRALGPRAGRRRRPAGLPLPPGDRPRARPARLMELPP